MPSAAAAVALLRRNWVPLAILGIALIGVASLHADHRRSRELAAQQRLNSLAVEVELKLSAQVRMHSSAIDVHAWCDAQRIGQVLFNLLSNAIKFSRNDSTVSVSLLPGRLAHGRPALQVSVSDQGVGIPEAELKAIFEKFVQSSKTKTGSGGTGLGLSICRQILEDHGGQIWAENSRAGHGAVVHFVLPLARYEASKDAAAG